MAVELSVIPTALASVITRLLLFTLKVVEGFASPIPTSPVLKSAEKKLWFRVPSSSDIPWIFIRSPSTVILALFAFVELLVSSKLNSGGFATKSKSVILLPVIFTASPAPDILTSSTPLGVWLEAPTPNFVWITRVSASWSPVTWSSSIWRVSILLDAIFVESMALSAIFPVAIVFAAICVVVIVASAIWSAVTWLSSICCVNIALFSINSDCTFVTILSL